MGQVLAADRRTMSVPRAQVSRLRHALIRARYSPVRARAIFRRCFGWRDHLDIEIPDFLGDELFVIRVVLCRGFVSYHSVSFLINSP